MSSGLHFGQMVIAIFVCPVGSNALFGHAMHVLSTNLKLHRHTKRAHQGGVQRLVAIQFWNRNVILKFTRHGLIQSMQYAQGSIALVNRFDGDTKSVNIQYLRKAQMLLTHLHIDAVQSFFSTAQIRLKTRFAQGHASSIQNLGNHFFTIAPGFFNGLI